MNIRILTYVVITFFAINIASAQWKVVPSPSPANDRNILRGTGAISHNDVWAVGVFGQQPSFNLIEHWNGQSWEVVNAPNPAAQYNELYDVKGLVSNDVFAVGNSAGFPAVPQMTALHWDGNTWTVMNTPTIQGGSDLEALKVFASNDVYAAGFNTIGAPGPLNGTLIMHWNGSQWDMIPSESQGGYRNFLTDIDGVTPSNMWAVGYSRNNGETYRAMILRKNGSAWIIQSLPEFGLQSDLYTLDVISDNDIWATGTYNDGGNLHPLYLHWNGSTWTQFNSPAGGFGTIHLAANDIWSTGSNFAHFDGTSWTEKPTQSANGLSLGMMTKTPSGDLWAIGRYIDGDVMKTLTMHYENVTGIGNVNGTPDNFKLFQNDPNPFNPTTLIKFEIPLAGNVTLKVFNLAGQQVATLTDGFRSAGTYEINFNGSNLSSGIYFYSLVSNGLVQTKKMVLIK